MIIAIARALMLLATYSFGETRREWAVAMQAEFQVAARDGRPLAFAFGCLIAAWREMPRREEGRFVLANYVLALGVLVPMGALQFASVLDFAVVPARQGGPFALPMPGAGERYLTEAYSSSVTVLLGLWILLGAGHLGLAWALLQRDWSRATNAACLMASVSATLLMFTTVLFLDSSAVQLQAFLLGIELGAVYSAARWHSFLFVEARFPA